MKKNHLLQLVAASVVLLFFMIACNSPKQQASAAFDITAAKKEIEEVNGNFMNFLSKADSVGVASCYTTDAKFMASNVPAVAGRNNIQSVVAGLINAGVIKLDLKLQDVWGTEALLAEEGEFTLASKEGTQLDKGKYIVLWKKEDGKWKPFRDIFNSDLPVPAAPAK